MRVFLNQLQSKYAMLVNAGKMSKTAQPFLAAEGKQCSQEQLAGGPESSCPRSNLELASSHQREEQGMGSSACSSLSTVLPMLGWFIQILSSSRRLF